jgi:uncharacterized DUF497 family protein
MVIVKLPSVLSFEWDKGNEQKNWIKHKVTGEEAEEAFVYDKRLILEDTKHSEIETRFILFGKTEKGRMLFIVYTLRNENRSVRIISARDAHRKEVAFYEKAINTTKI